MNTPFCIGKFKGLLLAGTFSAVVETLMGFSDSVIAGHLLGEQALASINLMAPIMTGVSFSAALIGVGMGINYSLACGRLDTARARQFFTQGVWTALLIGSALLVALLALRDPFLAFMAPGAEIAAHARRYWMWYFPSALLEPIAILLVNALYADGDARLCMATYVVQLTVNIGVSFVLTPTMGTGGCAFGTFVSNVCAITILSSHFLRSSNTLRLVRHFDVRDSLRIVGTSFGDASSFLCSASLFFFLNKFVISRYGSEMLPVLSVVVAMIGLLEFFNGVGIALSPILTVYAGEGNSRAMRMLMRVANRFAAGEGLALTCALVLFPELAVRLVGIEDPRLVPQVCTAVRIVATGFVFTSLVYLYNSYYLFIERKALAVGLTLLNGFFVPVSLVCLFGGGGWGPKGLWWALGLAPVVTVGTSAVYLCLRHGLRAFPLLLPRRRDEEIHMFDLAIEPTEIARTARQVDETLRSAGVSDSVRVRASLMTEETLMVVRDRNGSRRLSGEVALDLANSNVLLTIRDDGVIFDITDADQKIASLRTFLVASVMERQKVKMNFITTGFNRNVFRF